MRFRAEQCRAGVGRGVAAVLCVVLLLAARLGLGRPAWRGCRAIASGRWRWIGPRRGAGAGLVSSARLHQRLGMPEDESAADSSDASRRGWCFDSALLLRYAWAVLLAGPRPASTDARWPLLGLWLDNLDHDAILRHLAHWWASGRQRQIAFVNPHCAHSACKDAHYRSCLNRADLLLPDGSGVLLAGRLLGTHLQANSNGTDLFPVLCRFWQSKGASVYLLGGRDGVAADVATRMLAEYPGITIAGARHGYFDPADSPHVVNEIRAAAPDVLLVAMGVPTQDVWIAEHAAQLRVPLSIGVGGLFDFYSGRMARAPLWLRELGLAWCWRLALEPGRLWRRYLLGNTVFLLRVLGQRCARSTPAAPLAASPLAHEPVDAVLLASRSLWQGDDAVSTAWSLPVAGMSLLERTLLALVRQGVRHVHVSVDAGGESLRDALGEGERWGIRLSWSGCRGSGLPSSPFAALWLQQQLWLVVPGALPAAVLPAEVARLDLPDGSWSGWARVSAAQLCAPDAGPLPLPGIRRPFPGYPLRNPAELLQAQSSLLTGSPDLPPAYREVAARVWLGPGVRLAPDTVLEGPVLIGAGSLIRRGCRIGPNAVLGANCVLEQDVRCANTLLQEASYVARGLALSRLCAVNRQWHALDSGCVLSLAAADCLLAQTDRPARNVQWVERLFAGLCLIALRLRQAADLPAPHARLDRFLHEVWAGQRHLIGLPVQSALLSQDRLAGLRPGAIRLSALRRAHPAPEGVSQVEQAFMDDLYGAAKPCPVDLGLFVKALKLCAFDRVAA